MNNKEMLNKQEILENQLKMVRNDWLSIRFIDNPCLEVQLEAVKRNGQAIAYIDNPCVEVQLEAIKQNKFLITFIKNPCEEVKSLVYGELTNIVKDENVCNKCIINHCKYFEDEYIRSGCPYLIEHKVLS